MTDKTTIEGDVVTVVRSTKHSAEGKAYELNWTLDFGECTPEQVLELATRSIVISLQRQFRTEKGNPKDWDGKSFDVAEVLAESRKRAKIDPKEQARRLLAGMSEDEREAFLGDLVFTQDQAD